MSFFQALRQPNLIAILASLGIHGLLALNLPILSASSKPEEPKKPETVKVVQLTPAEQNRLPQPPQPPPLPPSLPLTQPLQPNLPLGYIPIHPDTANSYSDSQLIRQPKIKRDSPRQSATSSNQDNPPKASHVETKPRNRTQPNLNISPNPSPQQKKITPHTPTATPPPTPTLQTSSQPNVYAYNPKGTSDEAASLEFTNWLKKVQQISPDLVTKKIDSPIPPIKYPPEMWWCPKPEPKGVGFGVLVLPLGKVDIQQIRSSGYFMLDRTAQQEVSKAFNQGSKQTGKPVAYQVSVIFNPSSCHSMSVDRKDTTNIWANDKNTV